MELYALWESDGVEWRLTFWRPVENFWVPVESPIGLAESSPGWRANAGLG